MTNTLNKKDQIEQEKKQEKERSQQTLEGIDAEIKALEDKKKLVFQLEKTGNEAVLNAKEIADINQDIAEWQAKRDALDPPRAKGRKRTIKQLRIIRDIYLEISNLKDKKAVIEFDIIANDEDVNFKDREDAFIKSASKQINIANNTAKAENALIDQKLEKE